MKYKYIFSILTICLFLIAFLGTVFRSEFFTYAYYIFSFILFAAIPLFVLTRREEITIGRFKLDYWILFTAFFTYLLFTAFFSQYLMLTVSRVAINFLPLFAFSLVYSQSDQYNTVRILMNSTIIITVMNTFFVAFLHFFGDINYVNDVGRINKLGPFYQLQYGLAPFYRYSGFFKNPNAFALWILFSVTAYEFTRFKYNKNRNYLMYLIFLILLFSIFSRAGALSVLVFYAILIFLLVNKNLKYIFLGLAGIATLLASLLFLTFGLSSGGEGRLSFSLNARDVAWNELFSSIAENPFVGVGFGVSNESILQVGGLNFSAHNLHLQMISEAGIIGYILFLIVYFYPIFIVYTKKKRSKSDLVLVSFLVAFFIHQMFENTLFRGGLFHLTWFFFSYILLCGTGKLSLVNTEKLSLTKR